MGAINGILMGVYAVVQVRVVSVEFSSLILHGTLRDLFVLPF